MPNSVRINLVDQGVLDPQGPQAAYAADYLEDRQFIDNEFGVITAEATRKDWFNRGGFGRAQPFYGRFVQMHGHRDDVKPFIRSYFNQLGSHVQSGRPDVLREPRRKRLEQDLRNGQFPAAIADDVRHGAGRRHSGWRRSSQRTGCRMACTSR